MIIAALLVAILVVAHEERVLRSTFGVDYEEYCRNVRRWIPRLRPWYAPSQLD
jgi:protein-S-isoprenylcysteine O-methyltransferase Ste14